MKTTKSIIVTLFVLLTAQIASAYYCPSTGRWLSRDPVGEPGFEALRTTTVIPMPPSGRWISRDPVVEQILLIHHSQLPVSHSKNAPESNLYLFVNNNAINNNDLLGLSLTTQDWFPIWQCFKINEMPTGIKVPFTTSLYLMCTKNCYYGTSAKRDFDYLI